MRRAVVYATIAMLSISGGAETTFARQAPKPSPPKVETNNASVVGHEEFIRLFASYGAAVWRDGMRGLESFATPDFKARSGNDTLTNRAAFTELGKYLDGMKGQDYALAVNRLVIKGDTLTALVTESCTSTEDLDPPRTGKGAKARVTTATMYWRSKQTWRKTPNGWKFAVYERDDTKAQDKPSGYRFALKFKPELSKAAGEKYRNGFNLGIRSEIQVAPRAVSPL